MNRRPNDTGALIRWQRQVASQEECRRVLAAIDASPGAGATIKEIAVATSIVDSTVSARLGDLRDAGIIEECPLRRKCRINGYEKKVFARTPASGQLSLPSRRSA